MSSEYLELNIEYDGTRDEFKVGGGVKADCQHSIVEAFVMGQVGAGRDERKARELDVYHIGLKWYPENDRITVRSDTGNKGLRDGILMKFLSNLV